MVRISLALTALVVAAAVTQTSVDAAAQTPAAQTPAAQTPAAQTPAASPAPAVSAPAAGMTRYMVTRTFPAGALDGLDAAGVAEVNKNNAKYAVHWVYSNANPAKTKTFCIYEAPNKQAIQDAARLNKLPVDEIMEIPNVLGAR